MIMSMIYSLLMIHNKCSNGCSLKIYLFTDYLFDIVVFLLLFIKITIAPFLKENVNFTPKQYNIFMAFVFIKYNTPFPYYFDTLICIFLSSLVCHFFINVNIVTRVLYKIIYCTFFFSMNS